MCGIAGIVSLKARAQDYRSALDNMICALRHRGPDDEGAYYFENCAFGHTRLSIIDLESGHQPMLNDRQRVGITFNGEIYGYREIRASFKGYPFRTVSDTEVILALYERYGKDMLSRLPGMFAFGLWDEDRRELFCARDRFGEKPFYYAFGDNGEFIFASEIKALLASGLIYPVIRTESLFHYLQRLYVHPHSTIYENIYPLPPAHQLRFHNGTLDIQRYWTLPETNKDVRMEEAVGTFYGLLDQAVRRQLVADVPLAAFLSGGLDSSTIVAFAARQRKQLTTMSFGFEKGTSELGFAKDAAMFYQTRHIELPDEGFDIGRLLLTMADVYDEPFADSANIPTYLISRSARQQAKVVLTGDGADELLGGYGAWYRPLLMMESECRASFARYALLRLMSKTLALCSSPSAQTWKRRGDGVYFRRKFGNIIDMHSSQNCYFSMEELADLGLGEPQAKPLPARTWTASDTVDDALRLDLEDYLPGDILVKLDRASMAHGLEVRTPFLDVELASFCITLPSRFKISTEEEKILLRRACAEYWPESIRRRSKQGFGAPVNFWLKKESVVALKDEYLNNRTKMIFNWISFEHSRRIYNQDNYQTWILLVLSIWMEKHG